MLSETSGNRQNNSLEDYVESCNNNVFCVGTIGQK
jgi:hypothetical protein